MTPKEKAEELVLKFTKVPAGYGDVMWSLSSELARQIALECVDEILKDKEIIDGMRIINDAYWLEVKQEIKLL
jgi:hypothetical protein